MDNNIYPTDFVYDGSNIFIKDDCGLIYMVRSPDTYNSKDYTNSNSYKDYQVVSESNLISCISDIINIK